MSDSKSYQLLRGGRKINVKKVPNRITVKKKSGTDVETITRAVGCEIEQTLYQQNLTLVQVPEESHDAIIRQMQEIDEVAFVSSAFTLEGDPAAELYLTNELTLQFKDGTESSEVEALMLQFGLEYTKEVRGMPNCHVFRLSEENRLDTVDLSNRLIEQDIVTWCEPIVVYKKQNFYIPTDPLFSEQWHLDHNGGILLAEGSHVDAVRAWDQTLGDRSIVVAIADDSIDLGHRDFQGEG